MAPKAMKRITSKPMKRAVPMKAMKATKACVKSAMKASRHVKRTRTSVAKRAKKQVISKRCVHSSNDEPTIKLAASKRRAIISSLKHVKAVPACVRKLLAKLDKKALSSIGNEHAIQMLGSFLQDQDAGLQQAVTLLSSQVDDAEAEKSHRSAECSTAEARITELKHTIAESKIALKDASRTIHVAQDTIAREAGNCKREGTELAATSQKKQLLATTKEKTFTPLKGSIAKGAKGEKKVKDLCKVGKQYGFHDVLVRAIPAIVRTHPDRRRTFDTLAMRSFSAEFSKTLQKLEESIESKEAAVADRRAAEESARNAMKVGKETQTTCTKQLHDAEQELAQAQKQLAEMKRRMRAFPKELREQIRKLGKAKVQLSAFRAGPLAAFKELQQSVKAEPTHMMDDCFVRKAESKHESDQDAGESSHQCTDIENDFMPTRHESCKNML